MNKPVVFISHITEEAGLAKILQSYLKEAFLGFVDIFVSSDGQSIRAGDRWFEKINESLQSAGLAMILCSPASIRRPWINFEAGALHIRQVPVIPVCHSNLSLDDLPSPLNTLQGVVANEQSGLEEIIQGIADLAGASITPKIDFSAYARELQTFEQSNINQADAPQVNNSAEIAKIQSEADSYKTRLDKAQSDIKKLNAKVQDSQHEEKLFSKKNMGRINKLQPEWDRARAELADLFLTPVERAGAVGEQETEDRGKTKRLETETADRILRLLREADQVLGEEGGEQIIMAMKEIVLIKPAASKSEIGEVLMMMTGIQQGFGVNKQRKTSKSLLELGIKTYDLIECYEQRVLAKFRYMDEERQGKLLEIVKQMVDCFPENQK